MSQQPDNHVEEDIGVYLAGGMSPDQRRAFEGHVHGCPQCAAALEEAKNLEDRMTVMFAGARPGQGFEDRIIQKFRKRGTRSGPPVIHPMVRRVAVGVAAAIVLGGMGVAVNNSLNSSRSMGIALLGESDRGSNV